ncbi:DNA cytosine methyltransferase [Roseburia hominis]|uniref:DNA cytosine methyltransferase n=1 Tax=Roseburia hominis TaxID=301301 RepID=UPI002672FBF5|nr:DNA cytosine methyltransferase [Roseburia hominis]
MKTVDLFAGCGGMSLGFQNTGFNIVAAFEFWDIAAKCYEDNFDHPVFKSDLSNVESAIEQIRRFSPDLIIGGPPCQDFSHAGKRVEASRASLTESYAKIIENIKPQYFVMENVDRAQKSKAFEKAENIFKNAGYGLTKIVLDASKCGVPQKRKRFFCIGALGKDNDFMKKSIESGLSQKSTTLRDYFGDTLDFEYYYRHPRNYNRRAIFSIDEPAPTIRGVNRPVPKGYSGHPNDACPISENVRALTTLERSLIQTFPATFKWCGNKTEMEQMIGNAVPVKLAEYVALKLKQYIISQEVIEENKESFVKWLVEEKKFTPRSASDTLSRIRRADKICHLNGAPTDYYCFLLQKEEAYIELSGSVRSQMKRALALYNSFILQSVTEA